MMSEAFLFQGIFTQILYHHKMERTQKLIHCHNGQTQQI